MRSRGAIARSGVLLTMLLLDACASQVPQEIRKAPAGSLSLAQVRENADHYLGQRVRWGGTIIDTGNRKDATWLTVLEQPLYKGGAPRSTDDSGGRFIAIVPDFLDPKVYAHNRQVTVTGTLLRTEAVNVGEYPYTYPVVQADAWYLWPEETETPYSYPYPGWYNPWYYDPWYYNPWHPYRYPYYHPYRP